MKQCVVVKIEVTTNKRMFIMRTKSTPSSEDFKQWAKKSDELPVKIQLTLAERIPEPTQAFRNDVF